MQTFPLPLCQGIRGFSVTKQKALAKASVFALMKRSASSLSEEEAKARCLVVHLRRDRFECPHCGAKDVHAYRIRERIVQGARMGKAFVYLVLTVHRIVCPRCGTRAQKLRPADPVAASRRGVLESAA